MEKRISRLIDLDGAWSPRVIGDATYYDFLIWGPLLRYCAPARVIERFARETQPYPAHFTLVGSGDFHHLSAVWQRRMTEPYILVSFDNHPDWDIRPPFWCCGTWISRVLETPLLKRACVWGCANFELDPPHRWFANHQALRANRLQVWPWRDRFGPSARKRWPGIGLDDWKEQFSRFAETLGDSPVYVTVDLDCLQEPTAVTDWEQGLFQPADLVWAIEEIRRHTEIVAGDLCGAHSSARYVRWTQRTNAHLDHPKKPPVDEVIAQTRNQAALATIWPALVGERSHQSARQFSG
jgi:hypothetical protein